ncbi:MAG: hypothetical protein E7178_06770 [Erysipelotrichaceae bacterium]|nr:hypothetical protein [Erysipelotrichaceae bacterium]
MKALKYFLICALFLTTGCSTSTPSSSSTSSSDNVLTIYIENEKGEKVPHNVENNYVVFDVLSKSNYIFKGYSYNDELVVNAEGKLIKEITFVDGMIFVPVFTNEVTLTIQYDKEDEMFFTSISKGGKYHIGDRVNVNVTPVNSEIFSCWQDIEGNHRSDNANFTFTIDKDITLIPKFHVDTVFVDVSAYQNDLGSIKYLDKEESSYRIFERPGKEISLQAISKSDKKFLGWYHNDQLISNKETLLYKIPLEDNCSLVAYWDYFKVEYELHGGENNPANPTYFTLKDEYFTLKEPSKLGYPFLRWYGTTEGNKIYFGKPTNIKVNAIFDYPTTYKITYYPAKSASVDIYNDNPTTYNVNSDITLKPASYGSLIFMGWYDNPDYQGEAITNIKNRTGDISLYAKFGLCDELDNYELIGNGTNITIKGVKDKTITTIDLPESVTVNDITYKINKIEAGAFNGCSNLQEITLPYAYNFKSLFGTTYYENSIKVDGYYLPSDLKKVTVVAVSNIGENSFSNCDFIEEINLPNTLTYIGKGAFDNCNNNIYNIEDDAIYIPSASHPHHILYRYLDESITSFTNKEDTRVINYHALSYLDHLLEVTFTNDLESILSGAISNCNHIKKITISDLYKLSNSSDHSLVKIFDSTSCEDTYEVTYSYNKYNIPTSLTEVEVTDATTIPSNAFASMSHLTSIKIPNNVTSIGESAFSKTSITSIDLGDSLTSIGRYAFFDTKLSEVVLPDTVKYINDYAFNIATLTKEIEIPKSISRFYVQGHAKWYINEKDYPNLYNITNSSINGFVIRDDDGNLVTDITTPEGVSKIDSIGLIPYNATNLTVREGVETICKNAFVSRTLNKVYLPSTLKVLNGLAGTVTDLYMYGSTSVIDESFSKSGNASNIHIYLDSIDEWINMEGREYLQKDGVKIYLYDKESGELISDINIDNKYTSLPTNLFGCVMNNFENVTLPFIGTTDGTGNLITLGIHNAIKTLIVLEGATIVPSHIYGSYSSYIKTINLPDSITRIEDEAFYDCSNINSIVIPSNVNYIGKGAFKNCYNLSEITILSDKIDAYNDEVFYNTKISAIDIPNNIKTIGNSAFKNTSLTSINIPSNVTSIGASAFENCANLQQITFGENSSLNSIGNKAFAYLPLLTEINIPNTVETFGNAIFDNDKSLASITIPKVGFKDSQYYYGFGYLFGRTSFEGSTICTSRVIDSKDVGTETRYYLPTSFKTLNINGPKPFLIGDAFRGINTIETVNIQVALSEPLPSSAFSGMDGVKHINFIVPQTITIIRPYTFYDCNCLQSFILPSSIHQIEKKAFFGCISLSNVDFSQATGLFRIEDYAFSYTALHEVDIKSSITYLAEGAFSNCPGLTTIKIPHLNRVYKKVFDSTNNITYLDIRDATIIDKNAFTSTSKIETLFISSEITSIDTNFVIPISICTEYENGYYFGNDDNPYLYFVDVVDKSINTFVIHDDCHKIMPSGFNNYSSLTSLSYTSIDAIYSGAFTNTTTLSRLIYRGSKANYDPWIENWLKENTNITIQEIKCDDGIIVR